MKSMKKENKKLLSIFVVVIVVSAAVATALTFGMKYLEEGREEGQTIFVKVFADKTEGILPMSVNLSIIVDYHEGGLKYSWDFGDGNTSKEESPTVLYTEGGEYTCSVKVTDREGNTKTDSINIIAKRNKPPVVTLSINQNTINREFNWLEILSLTPIAGYAGNQQIFLDGVEERKGANAWGEGRIVVTAQIMDPEDDEIASYDWKVQTADSLVTSPFLGSKELLPVKNLTGKISVTIPELYAWMGNDHLVILTVTDSAGNNATADIRFSASQSLRLTKINGLRTGIKTGLPFLAMFWGLQFIEEPISKFLDAIWLDLPPALRSLILGVMNFIRWDYDPPIPKADLTFSTINDIDLSAYVNDTTGEVENDASASSLFTITNNDSEYVAENIYICLRNPFSDEEGLDDEIENEDLIVSVEGGTISNKLFYRGEYTNWKNCYKIEKLSPGDSYTLDLAVLLKEDGIFSQGRYENCTLYIYQEKSPFIAENIDEIPFTIIL